MLPNHGFMCQDACLFYSAAAEARETCCHDTMYYYAMVAVVFNTDYFTIEQKIDRNTAGGGGENS